MTPPGSRLANATSPYLRQHATNPVNWYPWGDEAFAAARERAVPIFLSVGYAACHWCHVMERESFVDPGVAALLNAHFVSIKVDREERPDIDGIYMTAVQAMTGQGGWPMSVFMTPTGEPFWAATYLPDTPRHGMPAFRQVLEGIAQAWDARRDDVVSQGAQVTSTIDRALRLRWPGGEPSAADPMDQLAATFDARWGGFGGAPKFPNAPVLEWLLRRAVRGDRRAQHMLERTLEAISDGGIHDQVTGGFARYSTDAAWHVPHFEKMLFDNAQLLTLYTRAWLHTRRETFSTVAVRTADALLDTFALPEGGFASSTDADSDGKEGAFATWSWDELVSLVGPAVADAFGTRPDGNWDGTNVLWRPEPLEDVGARHGIDRQELAEEVERARERLTITRRQRPQPALDDKVVAAWNGLAVVGLATAARAFGDDALLAAAIRCGDFLWNNLRVDGRLQRAWRAGTPSGPGFLDDHALVGLAMLTVFETTADVRWFDRARELASSIERLFWTDDGPAQTGRDTDTLIVRPRERTDDVTPSGPSATAELFVRLGRLTGEAALEDHARSIVELAGDHPNEAPSAFGHLLCVRDLLEGPTREVAIVGDPTAPATRALFEEVVSARYLPNVVLATVRPDDPSADRILLLRERSLVDGKPTAFVCERFACQLPVTAAGALANQLTSG